MTPSLNMSNRLNVNKSRFLLRRGRDLRQRQPVTFLSGRGASMMSETNRSGNSGSLQQQQQRQRCYNSRAIASFSPSATPSNLGQYETSVSFSPSLSVPQNRQFSWWNPFSKSDVRDKNAVVGSSRTKTESEEEEPRKLQERKDLTLLMLALEFHKIAAKEDLRNQSGEGERFVPSPSHNYYLENREKIIDLAFERLEEIEIDKKSMMQLRYALQEALEEQVVDLFGVFSSIDEDLLLLVPDGADETPTNGVDIESYLKETLRLELERTIDELGNTNRSSAPKGADPNEFLTLKRGAIETLLGGKGGENRRRNPSEEPSENGESDKDQNRLSWSEADEFGYHESIDEERNRLIRHYQSINLCRSARMRDKVGYSVVALRSCIPGAGRGVYVDGYARAGSILAFQPGPVWAKENLVNLSVDEERDLERNDSYQMSLRADDFMIDSRRSPYTVLTDDNSNLLALGHIVNHPTPSKPPSCRSAMLNFTQGMELGSSPKLKRYIPNTYARPRNVTLMDSLWDRDVIEMHSMVLVATRDVCDEEIFYDYRLASGHLPQWYHRVNDTAYDKVEDIDDNETDNDKQEGKKE